MRKISWIKKIKLFLNFRKTLKKNEKELEDKFKARVDSASRIYTVINLPPDVIEEPYNLKKDDIDKLAKRYIMDYSNILSSFLNSKNLMELYDYYDVKKVEKYSYLVIFGFSLFDSAKFLRNLYITLSIFSILLLIVIAIILF